MARLLLALPARKATNILAKAFGAEALRYRSEPANISLENSRTGDMEKVMTQWQPGEWKEALCA